MESSDSTFAFLPSSSSFELKRRRRTVEDQPEKISRAQESSLHPLSRSIPSFPYSPRLPHSPLPRSFSMHTRLHNRSVTLARPPQSVAALLPAEIVDCIFFHFDFDYSMEASQQDRQERDKNLSSMSVVAEGWTGPARRKLFRNRRVVCWDDLTDKVVARVGGEVRNITLDFDDDVCEEEPQQIAKAVFKLIKSLPNLRILRIWNPVIGSFDARDSQSLRTTSFLPLLSEIIIDGYDPPRSAFSDLLATSNHQISRLTVDADDLDVRKVCDEGRLDFGGKLRYLKISHKAHLLMMDPSRVVMGSLRGLRELEIRCADKAPSVEGTRELVLAVAPSLETLSIEHCHVNYVAGFLPLLERLTHLSLTYPRDDSTPLFLTLPPCLSFLRLSEDDYLQVALLRWITKPSLVPNTLKHIHIDVISYSDTLKNLPNLERLSTKYHRHLLRMVEQLVLGSALLTTLDVSFDPKEEKDVEFMKAECRRLKVEFYHNPVVLL